MDSHLVGIEPLSLMPNGIEHGTIVICKRHVSSMNRAASLRFPYCREMAGSTPVQQQNHAGKNGGFYWPLNRLLIYNQYFDSIR